MVDYDILICGGGVGACAAALAACKLGRRALMTEATEWIGGQLTSQAVPADEHPNIEDSGCSTSYRAFRDRARAYYRDHYPLTEAARANPRLNPGGGFVSRICMEPKVALAVLEGMLAPYVQSGALTILRRHAPTAAMATGDIIDAVTFRNLESAGEKTFTAKYVLDATETGEILALAGVEYVIGAESRDETGEPHAPTGPAQPLNHQAVTHCLAAAYHPGEEHVIARPASYDLWRAYRPPFWPGPLIGWIDLQPITLQPRYGNSLFGPTDQQDLSSLGDSTDWQNLSFFSYRKLRHAPNFTDGAPEVTLINWPMNDYFVRPLVDVPPEEAELAASEAKELTLSLLYWLQTEAPHPDGKRFGYPGLRPAGEITGTPDGLAKHVYIRESRRIKAEFTVVEQNIAKDSRQSPDIFSDSVGVGWYRIDLHPSTGGDNYIDIDCHPFQIPLGSLIPVRMDNLIPACKNIGVTHITNGCYRLHPVEWAIGEAAGALAAFSGMLNEPTRSVRANPHYLAEFQRLLARMGIPLAWD